MFVKAIETVTQFTRPFKTITRAYGKNEISPGCATFIIVNEEGWILTCKHVAEEIKIASQVNRQYSNFKAELSAISPEDENYKIKLEALEEKYHYDKKKNVRIQQLNFLERVVDKSTGFRTILHPTYDIALIHIEGYEKVLCDTFPVFAKDGFALKQGMSLCRLGYPYPEFTDFAYNKEKDTIEWTNDGRTGTPLFPIDGILTRFHVDANNRRFGVELSTPGLKGQSGGPLFDAHGLIYGIQSSTMSLPLGFNMENVEVIVDGIKKKVNDYSFIHLGVCIHVDVIKEFMDANHVEYQVG